MANIWSRAREQALYLLRGPGSSVSSSEQQLITLPQPEPPLRTSLVFDSHILTEAAGTGGKSKMPQTISSAWDERNQWGDETAASWQGLTAQDRKLIMLDIYLNNSAASSCVDVISKRIFSGGVTVEKVDEEGPDNAQHYDTLMEFLMRINPDWDFMQLGRSLVQDKLIFGECYAEVIWKNGLPWNLIKVDCIPMGYRANKWGQIERFYQQLDSTRMKNWLDPQNIIRWWFPHPRASIDPFAPVEKVTDSVVIDKKMMVWMLTFFRQGAKFPYHIEGASDQDEADRLQTWFLQNVMGEKNAHKLPVTWGNAKIVPTGNAGALTMDFQAGMDRMDTMVYGAFGVPPAAVSVIKVGALGGNSGEDQDKSLIFNACDPVKQAFFEKLNDRIVKRGFGITDYKISARYADYRSDESVSKVEDTRIKNGSRTVDEIRLESGKKPYKQGGGTAFIFSTKEIVPLERLDEMADEQRQTAAVSLDSAKAAADLAQTKAKQAKEPPEPVPPALSNNQQQIVSKNATDKLNGKGTKNEKSAPAQQAKNPQGAESHAVQQALADSGPSAEALCSSSGSQSESSGVNTGAMVAFMLPPEIGSQIAIAGGEPVDQLHITLALLGNAQNLPIGDVEHLKTVLSVFAYNMAPVRGRVSGIGRFINQDQPESEPTPVYASVDMERLQSFHDALIECLRLQGYEPADTFAYTPHITLAYIDKNAPMPVESIENVSLNFEQVCLAVGDERTYFPLLGKTAFESAPDPNSIHDQLWMRDDIDTKLPELAAAGVESITWHDHPDSCDVCASNAGVTVKLGQYFPSGHQLGPCHPHCICVMEYHYADGKDTLEKSTYDPTYDPDATQKLKAVKVGKK